MREAFRGEQHVGEHVVHDLRVVTEMLERLVGRLTATLPTLHDLDATRERREGRAQFMARVRDEPALAAQGFVERADRPAGGGPPHQPQDDHPGETEAEHPRQHIVEIDHEAIADAPARPAGVPSASLGSRPRDEDGDEDADAQGDRDGRRARHQRPHAKRRATHDAAIVVDAHRAAPAR